MAARRRHRRRPRPRAAVHLHARRGDAGVGQRRAAGPRRHRRRRRPERGLLRVRLRPRRRRRVPARRACSACCSSARRRCRASSTGRTAPPPSSSATAPAPSCSSRATGPGRILGWDLGSDGSLRHLLHADVGGTIEMDGPEVFRRAVRIMVDSAERALDRAGVSVDDLKLFVPTRPTPGSSPRPAPSSASPRSAPPTSSPPPATRRRPRSRWPWPTPPTPVGSHAGDLVLLIGFGAGMSWASAVIEWAA